MPFEDGPNIPVGAPSERQGGARGHVLDAQTIPSSDITFRRVVDRAAGGSVTPTDLAARLRPLYPRVRVVERQLSGERYIVYVYRDGAFVPPNTEAWWESDGTSAVTISTTTGSITAANNHVGSIFGARPSDIVGRSFTDFLLPEALASAQEVFRTIVELGEARSQIRLRRADGSESLVEFRAVMAPDGIRVWYREA